MLLYRNNPVSHFVYGYKGNACYFDDNTNIEITPGTLCYIPKGTTIHFREDDKYEYYKIYFNIYDAETNEDIIFSDKPLVYFNNTPKEIKKAAAIPLFRTPYTVVSTKGTPKYSANALLNSLAIG